MDGIDAYSSSSQKGEGSAGENGNGVKRSRPSSSSSFGKEEKKEENGATKLTTLKKEGGFEKDAMKIDESSPKEGEEVAVVENNPPPIIKEEVNNEKLSAEQDSDERQEFNAESAYTNKVRSSEGARTSERRGDMRSNKMPQQQQQHMQPAFGLPLVAERKGNFPDEGSILGHFFCVGKLGAGTFSSIHKCVNLNYFNQAGTSKRRLAAAKVELSDFSQSGVLESEAMILEFLHQKLPTGTVPTYMGHYKSGNYGAILMEYLPGEDMHHLRETVMAGTQSRRISVKDAVYLTADVMLPLLEQMHSVGVVHRDVKPSNCVRSGTDPDDKSFCLVDFGLSKSIVVPEDSAFADKEHPWIGKDWLKPKNYEGGACMRKEREKADFRGTSMYASPRVHQMKDYCPRDDVWSVLYVFCDLVSGGLPWMSHAANRERDACQRIKESVHGESGPDETERLLMGDEYHVIAYRNEQKQAAGDSKLHRIPDPLVMSRDQAKVDHLRTAFRHLSTLRFWDRPDYALVQRCIKGFLDDASTHPAVKPIDWQHSKSSSQVVHTKKSGRTPTWDDMENLDPIDTNLFDDAESSAQPPSEPTEPEYLGRLPLRVQFRYRQLDYHLFHGDKTQPNVILRDWLAMVLPLLYDEWDSKKYEEGGHRTATDGYRRETYLQILRKCWECAKEFSFFQSPNCVFHPGTEDDPLGKRRRINTDSDSPLTTISRALFFLEKTIKEEEVKRSPPPKLLSFG